MKSAYQIKDPSKYLRRQSPTGIIFPESAKTISIFDSRGRLQWMTERGNELGAIHWDARTLDGTLLGVGSYTCKIIFMDGQMVYVPFLFVR